MRHLGALATMALLALVGCQQADPIGGRASWNVDAVLSPGLTVTVDAETLRKLGLGQRELLATVADIAYVTVVVQPQGKPEQTQTLQKAQLVNGQGSVTFPNLPAVPTTVRISAFDATTALIGSGSQTVNVAAGQPTVVAFQVPLDPTYILPIGSITGSIGFTDGKVIQGTPPPNKVTPPGTLLQTLAASLAPAALAFDKAGNAWIAAFGSDQIHRFDPTGTKIDTIKVPIGSSATAARPTAIAFDPTGNAWVASYQAGTVSSISPAGKVLATFPVGLYPTSLAFDATGNLWVANYFGDNVTKINVLTGKPAGLFKTGKNPIAVTIAANGSPWVTCLGAKQVQVLNPTTGAVQRTLATGLEPETSAFDPSGNFWVVNNGSNNVMKFDTNGTLLGTYPVGRHPRGLGFDKKGYVWIASTDDARISRYDLAGKVQGTPSVIPKGARDVVVDNGGNVWVVCYDANSVVKLAP
jgi:streptogramin lyase